MSEGEQAVKEAKELTDKFKPDLVISDVPKETLRIFKEFADKEFSTVKNDRGHYGFALKFLLDFYLGRIISGSEIAEAKADEALEQIAILRSEKPEGQEKKIIRTVNGKELRI